MTGEALFDALLQAACLLGIGLNTYTLFSAKRTATAFMAAIAVGSLVWSLTLNLEAL